MDWQGKIGTRLHSLAALCACLAAIAFGTTASAQQTLTVEELIESLKRRAPADLMGPSRGSNTDDLAQIQRNCVHVEPGFHGRVDLVDRRELCGGVWRQQALPIPDITKLEVHFDYDSTIITSMAMPTLNALGCILSDSRLSGCNFIVAGHTDAKGGADYNQALSQRRAKAVRDFLTANFSIEPGKLVAMGHGEEQLKRPDEPFAGVNRRVQLINWTGVASR